MAVTVPKTVEAPGMKRIRILDQKQSKHGCRTCKKRKLKCDENLPTCLRCTRSGRECAGYERIARSKLESHQQDLALAGPVGSPPWYEPEQQSMTQLTLALFSLDPHQLHNKPGVEVSSVILPQLAATRPCVNAAAGTLGAAYDQCVLRRGRPQNDRLITKLYLSTLQQMQIELQRPEPEIIPLLMAAMLLAAAESIQHKPTDALCHFLGAFSLISGTSPQAMCATSLDPVALGAIMKGLGSVQDLLLSVDSHISMFAWGRSPQFSPLPVTRQMLYPASIDDLTIAHPPLQQWGLHFLSKALMPEWEERTDFPPALRAQQDHLVAWLKRWLRTYALLFNIPSSQRQSSTIQTPHFSILKAQTLTMLIAASNVKPPTQVTYDTYAPEFEDIIRCAESVINLPSAPNTTNTSSPTSSTTSHNRPPLLPYSPVPGIIHPLYFTARKYRDSISRRRAIHLLRHAGIEGPFHGAFEASVAARIVELEEGREPFKPVLDDPAEILPPSAIEDRRRVYMCWIVSPTPLRGGEVDDGGCFGEAGGAAARRVMKFSRRRLPADRPRSGAVRTDNGARLRVAASRDGYGDNGEAEMWDTWEEVVVEDGTWSGDK